MRTYLVRLNLDIKEKNIRNALRFRVASLTIKSLSKPSNKIVVLAHRGRPKKFDKSLSLKPFASLLSKSTSKKVLFISKIADAKQKIDEARGGSVFLLENLRFEKGERENSEKFARVLAELGDEYINNDFATSHRSSPSTIGITKFIPSKNGEIIKNEIKALEKAAKKPARPLVLIMGGAKIEDKAGTIKELLPKTSKVLLGGGVANTFLAASGVDVRKSLYEPEMVRSAKALLKSKKIIYPVDFSVKGNAILDIGPETIKRYTGIIKSARTIIWAGPMGKFEDKEFRRGNDAIGRAVLRNKKAKIIIGGADTLSSLPIRIKSQKQGNILFSTGGSAMLQFLAGKKMPAIAAIELGEPRQRREAANKSDKRQATRDKK